MADHVLADRIMDLTLHHSPLPGGATLCVDYKLHTIFDMDDATKVFASGLLIRDIGKDLEQYNCVDTGVFVATRGLMQAIQEIYDQKGDASLTDGVKRLAIQNRMQALDIGDAFWQDVDTPDMLSRARKLIRRHTGNGWLDEQ
jgi:choline kinase